jgi:hypothetical protein
MNNTHSTPAIIARTLRILANELLLLAESIKDPLTPTVRAGIQRDLIEIRESLTRCADDLETGHT